MNVSDDKDLAEKEKARQFIAAAPRMDGIESTSVEFGEHNTGDPAMWLVFRLQRDLVANVEWVLRFNEYAAKIQTSILHSGLTRFPYVRLEQAA
ncbi:MAG: hypothetical protein M3Y50_13490 [Acidobacteriota bacterium]|nr:hypothetical protein [Acidobacteriota bacterium]